MIRSRGFTLMELLIVIAIAGIMASMVLIFISSYMPRARDSQRKSDLRRIVIALEDNYNDTGKYSSGDMWGKIAGIPWGNSWLPYMKKIPKDPLGSRFYFYETDKDPEGNYAGKFFYILYAKLENTKDPDIVKSGCSPACGPDNQGYYNYAIHSPNITINPVLFVRNDMPLQPSPTPRPPTSTPVIPPTSTPTPPAVTLAPG